MSKCETDSARKGIVRWDEKGRDSRVKREREGHS